MLLVLFTSTTPEHLIACTWSAEIWSQSPFFKKDAIDLMVCSSSELQELTDKLTTSVSCGMEIIMEKSWVMVNTMNLTERRSAWTVSSWRRYRTLNTWAWPSPRMVAVRLTCISGLQQQRQQWHDSTRYGTADVSALAPSLIYLSCPHHAAWLQNVDLVPWVRTTDTGVWNKVFQETPLIENTGWMNLSVAQMPPRWVPRNCFSLHCHVAEADMP